MLKCIQDVAFLCASQNDEMEIITDGALDDTISKFINSELNLFEVCVLPNS